MLSGRHAKLSTSNRDPLLFELMFMYHVGMTISEDLDPAALLAAEQASVAVLREAAVEAMDRLLGWCDIHSVDPQSQPEAVPVNYGGDKLVRIGGEGTPKVAELCFEEFAIASRAGVIATTNKAADFLDLRHRLPNTYDAVRGLRLEIWVARKVASMSRKLAADKVWIVDVAVAEAAAESAGRILAIAEAKVIEADPEAHRAKIAAEQARTGVWLRRQRPGRRVDDVDGAADVQAIGMRLTGAGAANLDETIDALAQALGDQHEPEHEDDVPTLDQLRAQAAELLANPHAAAQLLDGPADTATEDTSASRPVRKPAMIVAHLHQDVLSGEVDGVVRVEGMGPLLVDQLAALLANREITLQPVIDLNVGRAVNGYEHPTACKQRTLLRTTRDVFPHSSRLGTTRLDHDHATPYEPNGPPGQTGDHNDAPLFRRDHRAKTHLGYRVRQLGLGAYRWQTPHGLTRVVTGRGTDVVEPVQIPDTDIVGEIYDTHVRIECEWPGR